MSITLGGVYKERCTNFTESIFRHTEVLNMESQSSDDRDIREPFNEYFSFELVRSKLLLGDDDDDGYILQSTNK